MAPSRFGSCKQQRNGRWKTRYVPPGGGKEVCRYFKTKREGEKWLKDEAARLAQDRLNSPGGPTNDHPRELGPKTNGVPPATAVPTVAEYAPIWRAGLIDKSPATLARTDSALRAHILPEWGDQKLDTITTLQVRQWLARLVNEDRLAANSATRMLRILSAMLQVAAEHHGYLTANPARGVRPPRARTGERRFLTATELYKVAEAIDSRYSSFILFAGFSGLRFAELTALRVRDINPLRGWVRVERTLTEVSGILYEGAPKSAAGRRTVSLPPTVIREIMRNLEGKSPDDLIFTAPEGGPLRRTLFAKRFWKPALRNAGLPPAGLHSLRHTAVATWLEAGASLREAQARAGHSSGALTLSIYGHVTPDAYEATTRRLEDMAQIAADHGVRTWRVEV